MSYPHTRSRTDAGFPRGPCESNGMEPVGVGIVGCGAISAAYLKMAPKLPILRVVACSDLDMDRARARAAEFSIPRTVPVEQLLEDPEVEIVLNLTVPKA